MKDNEILDTLNYIPQNIYCAQDYERLATRFIAQDRYAYIAGGSRDDITLKRNRRDFESLSITPRVLQNSEDASLRCSLGELELLHPFMLAPVAHQKLVHPDAELATAQAAEAMQTGFVACTLSSYALEEISSQLPSSAKWFQLYKQPTATATQSLIDRALKAGYQAIVLTLDTRLQAPSFASLRSGFTWPKDLQAHNLSEFSKDTTEAPKTIFEQSASNSFDRSFIQQLTRNSPIPVYAKGILAKEEACELKDLGCQGLIISNHGGRAFDGAPSSLSVMSEIRTALGDDYPLILDSGIRSGADIFKAIASGADAVMIGRLQLYALSVAGSLGVAHLLKLLKEELEYTMAMSACNTLKDIRKAALRNENPLLN